MQNTAPLDLQARALPKLKDEIFDVQIVDNEWMCNNHPTVPLAFYKLTPSYEYYACPECGDYIKVD